jgi:hypothetical protein
MSLVQLFVPAEVAHDTVAELGELGNVEFKDASTPYISELSLTLTLDSRSSTPMLTPSNAPSSARSVA